jgi:hypothetical protein
VSWANIADFDLCGRYAQMRMREFWVDNRLEPIRRRAMERPEEDQSPKAQIVDLINRYFAAVDDRCLDVPLAEATFAPEGKIVRPNGAELVGPAVICDGQNESYARFRATHHVMTNYVVDLAGERARVRANVIATHLWAPGQGDPNALESHFTAGGVITAELVRLERGWRITTLGNRVVWRTGSGFVQMLATGRAPS